MNLNQILEQYFASEPAKNWSQFFEQYGFAFVGECDSLPGLLEKLEQEASFLANRESLVPVLLTSPEPEKSINDLLRFLGACKECQLDWPWNNPDIYNLLYLFGRSNFLTRCLIRRPQLIHSFLTSPYRQQRKPLSVMTQELENWIQQSPTLSIAEFKNLLRRYKYQEYLRITIKDLASLGPEEDILEELTSIATCTLQMTLKAATIYALKREDFSTADFQNPPPLPFTVLGMGKMGGNELNYSSDIDLIFIHDFEQLVDNSEKNQKLRQKIARWTIEWMSDPTEEGFLCRVDMRLRPGGDGSPLVPSLEHTHAYYWSKADLWEQQALIKARQVAGSEETGDLFFRMIRPYIYSRLIDENLLQEVEHIKNRIEAEHLRKNQLNVKLGIGGIREIEFLVQVFQILYGGQRHDLRTTNTLEALEQLGKVELLSPDETQTLRESYLFLRKVEHRLQVQEELQNHVLPTNPVQQQGFARLLDCLDAEPEVARQVMLQKVRDTMMNVRSIFGGLFSQKHIEIEAALRNSTRFNRFSDEDKKLLESVARTLAPIIQRSQHPLLETRFQRMFESIGPHFEYYQFLLKSPSHFQRLSTIAETSETLWNYLLNNPALLYKLDPTGFEISRSKWDAELKAQLSECAHEEQEIDQLRHFKHQQRFLIGSGELDGRITYEQAREGLTILAEVILQEAFLIAFRYQQKRFGSPIQNDGQPAKFAIIGMGKLGGNELTYLSDLDLIFLYSQYGKTDGEREVSNQTILR